MKFSKILFFIASVTILIYACENTYVTPDRKILLEPDTLFFNEEEILDYELTMDQWH